MDKKTTIKVQQSTLESLHIFRIRAHIRTLDQAINDLLERDAKCKANLPN